MEGGALVTKAVFPGAKLTEVLRGLGDVILVEVEVDAANLLYTQQSSSVSVENEMGL